MHGWLERSSNLISTIFVDSSLPRSWRTGVDSAFAGIQTALNAIFWRSEVHNAIASAVIAPNMLNRNTLSSGGERTKLNLNQGGKMKRKREQQGTIFAKCGMWYVRYSDSRVIDGQLQRKRLAKQLGSISDMKKTQARLEAKRFLATINSPSLPAGNAVKLVAFVDISRVLNRRFAPQHCAVIVRCGNN